MIHLKGNKTNLVREIVDAPARPGSFISDGNIPDWETNVRHVVIDDVSNGNEYVRLYTASWIMLFSYYLPICII